MQWFLPLCGGYMKKKSFEYLNPTKFESIKEMLEIADKEVPDKIAFK